MPRNNLVSTANKAKTRAKIHGNTHLDQRCPKEKRPLKISLNFWDDQADKKVTALQAKDKANQAEYRNKAKMISVDTRRNKK